MSNIILTKKRVIDRAIQVHGGGGVSDDFFLARAWVYARTMRIADGKNSKRLKKLRQKVLMQCTLKL